MRVRNVAFGVIVALVCAALGWWWRGAAAPKHRPAAAVHTPTANTRSASSNATSDDARTVQGHEPQQPTSHAHAGRPATIAAREPTAIPPGHAAVQDASPIDVDHVADLFSERLAKLEDIDTLDDGNDLQAARQYRTFKSQSASDAHAQEVTQALREHVEDWLAQFPPERQDHIALVDVECKGSLCQILLGQNAMNFSGTTQQSGGSAGISPEELLYALNRAPWWADLHLTLAYEEMHPRKNYALYTLYLKAGDGS